MSIRVAVVDDHAVVRQGLLLLMQTAADLEVVGEAVNGASALRLARETRPDVLLLDLLMPDMDGVAVLRALRQEGLPCKVLLLTSSLEDQLLKAAIEAGADGYLLKATQMTDLLDAVRRVAAGDNAFDPLVVRKLVQQSRQRDPLEELTAREREVFDLLARGQNYPEIAEKLGVSEATVRTHSASLLAKLDLRDRTQVMVYALKRGLVRLEDLP
jgi:DNA-binding NarL/FixJ family response regulator